MGRLAGFKYRQIIKKLKKLGFEFDRQAAGSHEIWFNPETGKYTTIPVLSTLPRFTPKPRLPASRNPGASPTTGHGKTNAT
jgi:predicted RNA binding protein YcfA (HicA-like mRNA interferase family)